MSKNTEKSSQIKIKNSSTGLRVNRTLSYILLVLLAILCLFPFYLLVINATRSHAQVSTGFSLIPGKHLFKNINGVLQNSTFTVGSGMKNSLIIAILSAFLTTYFSTLTAYAIHMYNFKLKKFAFTFIMMIMMVPTQVSALGFLDLIDKMHLRDTLLPLYLPAIASPITFFFMKQYMESVLPGEIVEAARVDGAHEFRTFNTIIIPIMKPALAVQAIFAFVGSWNNYFMPALVISSQNKKTLPILMAGLRSASYQNFSLSQQYVAICMAIVPLMIMYFILSKYIIAGVTLGSVKG
ncbi:MAG: carbohydrate ABC transporter permease [Clostridiales bacterium]|nr:carbohydrate ABC transporter permease [Clostridiales bacterium]